jgi:hypothetical protein
MRGRQGCVRGLPQFNPAACAARLLLTAFRVSLDGTRGPFAMQVNNSRDAQASGWKRTEHGDACNTSHPSALHARFGKKFLGQKDMLSSSTAWRTVATNIHCLGGGGYGSATTWQW